MNVPYLWEIFCMYVKEMSAVPTAFKAKIDFADLRIGIGKTPKQEPTLNW